MFRACLTLLKLSEKLILRADKLEELMILLRGFTNSAIDPEQFVSTMFDRWFLGSFPMARIQFLRLYNKAIVDNEPKRNYGRDTAEVDTPGTGTGTGSAGGTERKTKPAVAIAKPATGANASTASQDSSSSGAIGKASISLSVSPVSMPNPAQTNTPAPSERSSVASRMSLPPPPPSEPAPPTPKSTNSFGVDVPPPPPETGRLSVSSAGSIPTPTAHRDSLPPPPTGPRESFAIVGQTNSQLPAFVCILLLICDVFRVCWCV